MLPDPSRQLIEAYFVLRQESAALRGHGVHFEFMPWVTDGQYVMRFSHDGWRLCVYRTEGDIEATVIAPTGEIWSYS